MAEDPPIPWVVLPEEKEREVVAIARDMHDWDHILEAALLGARVILATAEEHGAPEIGECTARAVQELLDLRNTCAEHMIKGVPVDPKKLN